MPIEDLRENMHTAAMPAVQQPQSPGAAPVRGRHARADAAGQPAPERPYAFYVVRNIVLLGAAAVLAFLALEVTWNYVWFEIPKRMVALNCLIVFLAMLTLYFLGQRRGVFAIPAVLVCEVAGLAQYFLDMFKNTALLPSDVLALQTAAAVAGNYEYTLSGTCFAGFALCAAAIVALVFARPPKSKRVLKPARVAVNLALAAVCGLGLGAVLTVPDYQSEFGINLYYWDLRHNYRQKGFLVAFTAVAQDMVIAAPDGYTDAEADELIARYAAEYDANVTPARKAAEQQFDQIRPCVVAVMNETYSDLSAFNELTVGYKGTFVTQELQGSAYTGLTSVSVHGGSTCNSEYEFLSGSSMSFLSSGMYPFQQFNLGAIDTLPSLFNALGYETSGMHPNYPGNWNRDVDYASMGFQNTYFIDDFEGDEEYHHAYSDAATYDKVLEVLRSSDEPQFVFDVTMQNHSPYDTGGVPESDIIEYPYEFEGDAFRLENNVYLACIAKSDRDLKAFLEQLAELDRPVAVVFFGDHQPYLTRDHNTIQFPDEPDDVQHASRIMKTPYFIWANYEIAGLEAPHEIEGTAAATTCNELETSVNYLAALTLETIGAPLTDYQKAELVARPQVPMVSALGYADPDGTWHEVEDGQAPANQAYADLWEMHYRAIASKL